MKTIRQLLCFTLALMMLLCVCLLPASAAEKPSFTINAKSPLKGIKVGFYGDSICAAGVDNQDTFYANLRGWAGRIGVTNCMLWENHGVSGYSISNCRGDRTILAQLQATADKDYDMILLHGGTNDAWDNAPVGIMSKEFKKSEQYTPDTFASALEKTIAYARETHPDAIIGYIINFKFLNAAKGQMVGSSYRLNQMGDYVNMTINICKKWDIPYLDLYHNDELTAALHETQKDGQGNATYKDTYLYDYIHPSSQGYDMLYPYIEDFMIDLITPEPEPETTTAAQTTAPQADTTTVAPEAPAEQTEAKVEGGCGAFLAGTASAVSLTALLGAAYLARRKRK